MKHLVLFIAIIHSTLSLERDFFETVVIPSTLDVSVGRSIYIKIKNAIDSQTACAYKAPGQKETNSEDAFVKFSEDKCGIRIDNIQKSHAGAWQLISTFKNTTYETSIKGVSTVSVKESAAVERPEQEVFTYTENFAPAGIGLSYCVVSRDLGYLKMLDIDKTKCMIPQDLSSDFREGEWDVRMGILGQPKEVTYTVNVQSIEEKIETETKRVSGDNFQLLCRVKNLKNVLKFCRFERADGFGINLEVGGALDDYRYHGEGFVYGECGLEILKMSGSDRTQWKCFLGLVDVDDEANTRILDENKRIYKYSAVIDASDYWDKLKILSDESELFFVDNKSAIIRCNSNNPFDYCWFLHPMHKLLSVSDKKALSDNDAFQYYGDGFHLGHCGINIRRFHFSDEGEWKCGVGRSSESMREAVKTLKIEVKASFMMAITKQIEDFAKNSIAIQCRAIPFGSLTTCHFLTPKGEAFSINEQVMEANAIDGMYYFDPNRKLIDGYCTVIIKNLNKDIHAGKWTCSGRILGEYEESYDTVYVTVDGVRGASVSFLSIVITAPTLLVVMASAYGMKMWKRRQQVRSQALDEISMHTISSTGTQETTSSEGSRTDSRHSA